MQNKYNLSDIKDYIFGNKSKEAKKDFEKDLFKEETLSERTFNESMRQHAIEQHNLTTIKELRKSMRFIPKKVETGTIIQMPTEKRKNRKKLVWLSAAASILLLVVAIFLFNQRTLTPNQRIASQFGIIEDEMLLDRIGDFGLGDSEDKVLLELLKTGMTAYKYEEYNQAKDLLTQYTNAKTLEDYYRKYVDLYLAQIEIKQNNPQKAIDLLVPLSNKGEETFKDAVKWSLGLAYLNLDNKKQAINFFNQIGDSSEFNSKVKQILSELNE